jgi:probable rRNA maturation factor
MRSIAIANRHPRLRLEAGGLVRAIQVLDANAQKFRGGCPPGELSIVFLTDAALAGLHDRFLGDPAPTDVITFAGDPAHSIAGEICVSADAARRQPPGPRSRSSRSAAAVSSEMLLYVVHGWLHLAGYADLAPGKKRAMRAAETRALGLLRRARLQPGFRFVK